MTLVAVDSRYNDSNAQLRTIHLERAYRAVREGHLACHDTRLADSDQPARLLTKNTAQSERKEPSFPAAEVGRATTPNSHEGGHQASVAWPVVAPCLVGEQAAGLTPGVEVHDDCLIEILPTAWP